jgi:hypothetical protein
MRSQFVPDGDRQVLGTAHFALHKRYIEIQVPVIKFVNHLLSNEDT